MDANVQVIVMGAEILLLVDAKYGLGNHQQYAGQRQYPVQVTKCSCVHKILNNGSNQFSTQTAG